MASPEYDRDILNQIYDKICRNCHYKYWETCGGPHVEWGVIACKKARKLYEQLKGD